MGVFLEFMSAELFENSVQLCRDNQIRTVTEFFASSLTFCTITTGRRLPA
jgi:hypothetical protein